MHTSASNESAGELGDEPVGADPRFDRQTRFAGMGAEGQERILSARVLLVGCGALGNSIAQSLARSGVGELVVVDRDVVERSNLPRCVLFEDRHAEDGTPKVEAALESLARVGGPTRCTGHAAHVDAENLPELARGADLILDGTDNMSTRYLLNDFAVERGTPWVYGGVVGSTGLVLAVEPGVGPCLRCLFPVPPAPGTLATCDTAGVLQPAVATVAALQAAFALRRLVEGRPEEAEAGGRWFEQLLQVDLWEGDLRVVRAARQADCPCCVAREFPHSRVTRGGGAILLCGRNTVQVRGSGRPDLARLERSLTGLVEDLRGGRLLRFRTGELFLTVFPDGRALVQGTEDKNRARAVYDRFVGS